MTIYVDGDAFPNAIKEIFFRSIERVKLPAVFVSNKPLRLPESELVSLIIVEAGADVADDRIAEMVQAGDLVITADIPLADRIVSKGAHGIDHRGTLYSEENIKQLLAMRNLMDEIRSMGEMTGGPAPFGKKDAHEFANQLHRFLTKHCKA